MQHEHQEHQEHQELYDGPPELCVARKSTVADRKQIKKLTEVLIMFTCACCLRAHLPVLLHLTVVPSASGARGEQGHRHAGEGQAGEAVGGADAGDAAGGGAGGGGARAAAGRAELSGVAQSSQATLAELSFAD